MVRGEKEQKALNEVKSKIPDLKFYGFDNDEEKRQFVEKILVAKPNEKSSEFPDFKIENGFIEHFEVTGARENKKGSKLQQEKAT